jgi:hypothetical protein
MVERTAGLLEAQMADNLAGSSADWTGLRWAVWLAVKWAAPLAAPMVVRLAVKLVDEMVQWMAEQ